MGGSETILVIDDDQQVRQVVALCLVELGYTLLEAEHGLQGLEMASAHRGRLDLVLLDLSMPGLPGQEVLRRLQESNPQLKVIVCTGYVVEKAQLEGVAAVMQKPCSLRQLARSVRQVLDESST